MKRLAPRILAMVAVFVTLAASARPARAEVGVGIFIGRPLGVDLKIDLSRKTALDFVGGVLHPGRYGRDDPYAHLTFLIQILNIRLDPMFIPFRFGIGGAIYQDDGKRNDADEDLNLAARVPFQLGFRFIEVPIEIYLEVALRLELIDDVHAALDGGVGIRVYF